MQVGNSQHNYSWHEKWAKLPDSNSVKEGWAHHGICVGKTGDVISFHPGEPAVLIFDENGDLKKSWDAPVENAHGMTLVQESDEEFLWLADNLTGRVMKTTIDGEVVMSIDQPDVKIYKEGGNYAPTDVAVFEERFGGSGQIIITDGYGSSNIHYYDKNGTHLNTINGEEGDGGHFATPHGVWIDTRKSEAELYIADRSNGQIQVYGLDGTYKKCFGKAPGASWLHSPSGFASWNNFLIVAELRGSRVTLLDLDDNPVTYVGENSGAFIYNEGWPNVPHETLSPGKFNSPHGIAADINGNIYVAEWLIGSRVNKLSRST
jgi:hypothetical protein